MKNERMLQIFQIAKQIGQPKTVGELLNMKLVDSFLPRTMLESDWSFTELKDFCEKNNLGPEMSITDAVNKII